MAISLVQILADSGSSSIVTSATVAGNLLVMCFSYPLTPTSVTSVTDNVGNTWIQAPGTTLDSGNQYVSIWYCPNNLGGVTNVSWTGLDGGPDGVFSEWSGVDKFSPINSTNTTSGSGTVIGPNLTTTNTTSLLISCMSVVGNETGANSPWTFFDDASRSRIVGQAYLLPGSTGTFNSTYTPTTGTFLSSGIVFKASTSVINLVQENANNSTSIALTGTTAGNLLVLCINSENTEPTSVSDGVNTWIKAVGGFTTHPGWSDIWYAENIASTPGVLTVSPVSSSGINLLWISEWSGVATSGVLDTTAHLDDQSSGTVVGPSLTDSIGDSLLLCIAQPNTSYPASVSTPWTGSQAFSGRITGAYYIPGSIVTSQAVFNNTDTFSSAGAVFKAFSAPDLTLTLSDSVNVSDSPIIPSFTININLSDSINVSDSNPQSFSIQSDAVSSLSSQASIIETLVTKILPATVKPYFNIQE